MLSSKITSTLQNFTVNVGYFFVFLCFCKIIAFVLINSMGYTFDMSAHSMQILFALLTYTIHYFCELLMK
jgi:hypothetical protein